MLLNSIKNNKIIAECKFYGWGGKPWEVKTVYKCIDWKKPKGYRFKTPIPCCPKCRTLDPFIFHRNT